MGLEVRRDEEDQEDEEDMEDGVGSVQWRSRKPVR